MTSSSTEVLNFVQVSQTLWGPSDPSSSQAGSESAGSHTWPFSLTLPNECQIKPPNGPPQTFPLPASFSERMARVHIQYQLVVTVHRKRFRVDSTYVPCLRRLPCAAVLIRH